MYTDSDSLKYEIQCNDAYENIIRKDIVRFDISDYPKNNYWIILLVNKRVAGLIQYENDSKIITHFYRITFKAVYF